MIKPKLLIFLITTLSLSITITSCNRGGGHEHFNDGHIQYDAMQLTPIEKETVKESLKRLNGKYDPKEMMLTKTLGSLSFATDAKNGVVYHDVLSSLNYAIALLDAGGQEYTQRAFEVIKKTTLTQDQDPHSKSFGVFPYYLEEPLATKKSMVDENWADFCTVRLLDIWMGYQDILPAELKPIIKNAMILAAEEIQRRDCSTAYTNIAVMGSYVSYMVSHLFELEGLKDYSRKRLKRFYDYTLEKRGFSEYNSPTYSLVALDDLYRMKSHVVEPSDKQMVDSLYSIDWDMIARHYHRPTGQWAGPHSRSYGTLAGPGFHGLLNRASGGKIYPEIKEGRGDLRVKHQIPEHLLRYFLSPEYPRTETSLLSPDFPRKEMPKYPLTETKGMDEPAPKVVGTCYMTDNYVFSTASLSSMWTQRRPFLVYLGNTQSPKYLQAQFLHDNFDFSSAYISASQKENMALAAIHFFSNGGDKHIHNDRLKDGKIMAKDLRLRFKFGNVKNLDKVALPSSANEPFPVTLDSLKFNIQLCYAQFEKLKGHWEKGGDDRASWIDYIVYSGPEAEFDFTKMDRAVMSFTFSIGTLVEPNPIEKAKISEKEGELKVEWGGLEVDVPLKPKEHYRIFI
ncbi:MAG: hypothetical protein M0Q53_09335 [Prolixibacteraceae bacterium]|jgi:hypothetical protein|nr:hypothetical protein [Prolixibacteraceae bacterium]